MQEMELPADMVLRLVREAAGRRADAERNFRDTLVLARQAEVPMASIAEAASLSVSRVHTIIEEKQMQTYASIAPERRVATDDVVIVAAKVAYPDYLGLNAYICQDGRTFRDVVRMGFYRRGKIEPHFPAIRAVEDHVAFSDENAARLRATGSPIDREIADLIESAPSYYKSYEGEPHKVFLLTAPDDLPATLVLPQPIIHETGGRGSAFTQWQRYVSEAALYANPTSTRELLAPAI
jgi:hypothetical protein